MDLELRLENLKSCNKDIFKHIAQMPLTVYFKSSSHMTFFFVTKVRNIVFDS